MGRPRIRTTEECRKLAHQYYLANKERWGRKAHAYYLSHRGKIWQEKSCVICGSLFTPTCSGSIVCSNVCRLKRKRQTNTKCRLEQKQRVLDLLGNVCKNCGNSDKRVLQIDHINGGGNKEFKAIGLGHNFYKHILVVTGKGYQILCANCNWIKRHENNEN